MRDGVLCMHCGPMAALSGPIRIDFDLPPSALPIRVTCLVWSDFEWSGLAESERPASAVRIDGFGWIHHRAEMVPAS